MKKTNPYIKPIILLILGFSLMFIFKDKYIELFFSNNTKKDFIVEFTNNYKYEEGDILYNIDENIDSYIIVKINKDINNFTIEKDNQTITFEQNIKENTNIALMINHSTYNCIIKFNIDNKQYLITTTNDNDNLKINVEEQIAKKE